MDEISLQSITYELSQQKEQNTIEKYQQMKHNKDKLKKELILFIDHLKQNMHKKRYRIVLGEIENSENKYEQSDKYYQVNVLKVRCLLKVIERKIAKHQIEIRDHSSRQRSSIDFWFNQVYITLHFLIVFIITSEKLNIMNQTEEYVNLVESIVLLVSNTLYQLSLMTWQIQEVQETCAYIGLGSRLLAYADYMRNPKTLHSFQKLLLFRICIVLSDKDYANALVLIEKCKSICFKEFFLFMDYDEHFIHKNIKTNKCSKIIYENIINLVLLYYHRGAYFEKIGRMLKAIESYKQSRSLCIKYFQISQPEFTLLFNRIAERAIQIYFIIESIITSINYLKEKQMQKKNLLIAEAKMNNESTAKVIKQYSCKDNLIESPLFANTLQKIDKINSKEEMNVSSSKSKYPKAKYITSTVRLIDNLLSADLEPMVTKMKKMEISTFDKDTISKIRKQIIPKHSSGNMILRPILNKTAIHNEPLFRYRPNEVEKFPLDKDNFNKSYIKKKQFLEQYSRKELCFHKKMLTLKKCEKSISRGRFNPQDSEKEIQEFFFVKSTLAKTKQKKNVLQNLMSRNSETPSLLSIKGRSKSCYNMLNNPMQKINNAVRSSIFDFAPPKIGNKEYDKQTANDINFIMIRKITVEYDHIENYRRHLESKCREKRKVNKSICN